MRRAQTASAENATLSGMDPVGADCRNVARNLIRTVSHPSSPTATARGSGAVIAWQAESGRWVGHRHADLRSLAKGAQSTEACSLKAPMHEPPFEKRDCQLAKRRLKAGSRGAGPRSDPAEPVQVDRGGSRKSDTGFISCTQDKGQTPLKLCHLTVTNSWGAGRGNLRPGEWKPDGMRRPARFNAGTFGFPR